MLYSYLNWALEECPRAFFNFILDIFNEEKNSHNYNHPSGIKKYACNLQ